MEAVGLTAGIISIGTLVVQIGHTLRKATEFWESIQDAPAEVKRFGGELRLLTNVLAVIGSEDHAGRMPDTHRDLIQNALELAKQDIDELDAILSRLKKHLGVSGRFNRGWAGLKVVLKESKFAKVRAHIESAKSTLNLLQASRYQAMVCEVNGKLDIIGTNLQVVPVPSRTPAENSSCSSSLIAPSDLQFPSSEKNREVSIIRTTTAYRMIDTGLGFCSLRSISLKVSPSQQDTSAEKKKPAQLFIVQIFCRFATCRRGFSLRTNSTFDNWTFNTIRRRPGSSEIFRVCQSGDTDALRKLLLSGQASVFDVDESGWSPLHWACLQKNSQACQLLLDFGADVYLPDEFNMYPVELAVIPWGEVNLNDSALSGVLNVIFRYGGLDPFNPWPARMLDGVFAIPYGIPFQTLEYLVCSKLPFATPMQQFEFLKISLLVVHGIAEGSRQYVDFLLHTYKRFYANIPAMPNPVPSAERGILPTLTAGLFDDLGSRGRRELSLGFNFKIARALKITNELFYTSPAGFTVLDSIFSYNGGHSGSTAAFHRRWLRLLARNNIDIVNYCRWEFKRCSGNYHRVYVRCCRNIFARLVIGESDNDIRIEIEDKVDPKFAALDPAYICESGRRRENCLSQVDEAMIKDGRPRPNVPGGWEAAMKPNSQLFLVHQRHWGWVYVDEVQYDDWLWDESGDGYAETDSDFENDRDPESDTEECDDEGVVPSFVGITDEDGFDDEEDSDGEIEGDRGTN